MQQTIARDIENMTLGGLELLYEKPADVLSSAIRPMVQAPPGFTLLDADLNAIENRVLGWVAGEDKILKVFSEGRDPYLDFATYMFHKSYDEFLEMGKKEYTPFRTLAKAPVLGCGYRLGPGQIYTDDKTGEKDATGLLGYAWSMGIDMTPAQSEEAVAIWREAYKKVVHFWYELEDASKECVQLRRPTKCGPVKFYFDQPFLRMELPSGRSLSYLRPRVEMVETPWGEERPTLTYEGQVGNTVTWGRVPTHGGKLVENICQAVARDVLAHGMLLAHQAGLDIRMHVHDEVVVCSPVDKAEEQLGTLIACMETVPHWAEGLPLGAEGYISKCFIKD